MFDYIITSFFTAIFNLLNGIAGKEQNRSQKHFSPREEAKIDNNKNNV